MSTLSQAAEILKWLNSLSPVFMTFFPFHKVSFMEILDLTTQYK